MKLKSILMLVYLCFQCALKCDAFGINDTKVIYENHSGNIPASFSKTNLRAKRDIDVETLRDIFNSGMEMTESLRNVDVDSPKAGLDVALSILKFAQSASGQFGMIFAGLGVFLTLFNQKPASDRNIMLAEFSKVHSQFNAIHSELTKIEKLISSIPLRVSYQLNAQRILGLVKEYQRFNESKFEGNFYQQCIYSNPSVALNGIFTSGDIMVDMFRSSYDRRQVITEMRNVALLCLNGIKMIEACEATKMVNGDSSFTSIETLTDYLSTYKNDLDLLMVDFYVKQKQIKDTYWSKYVKNEIQTFVDSSTQLSHKNFVDTLYDFLSKKYYWDKFVVGSYSGTTSGYEEHFYSTYNNVHSRYRDPAGRSWFVALRKVDSSIWSSVKSCVKPSVNGGCLYFKDGADIQCIKSKVTRPSIICVRDGNDLEMRFDSSGNDAFAERIQGHRYLTRFRTLRVACKDINVIVT